MLSNAYVLAKFRFDTAENEPAKNVQNFVNFPNSLRAVVERRGAMAVGLSRTHDRVRAAQAAAAAAAAAAARAAQAEVTSGNK